MTAGWVVRADRREDINQVDQRRGPLAPGLGPVREVDHERDAYHQIEIALLFPLAVLPQVIAVLKRRPANQYENARRAHP